MTPTAADQQRESARLDTLRRQEADSLRLQRRQQLDRDRRSLQEQNQRNQDELSNTEATVSSRMFAHAGIIPEQIADDARNSHYLATLHNPDGSLKEAYGELYVLYSTRIMY
jgi:hypothetical protein